MLRKPALFMVFMLVVLTSFSLLQAQPALPLPDKNTLELLTNPGFEIDTDADKLPDGWTAKNVSLAKSDKIKCDKPDQPVAHSGNCAFMFRGNLDGTTSYLAQKITDLSGLTDGATLTFSAYVDPRSATPGTIFGKATVTLSDSSKLKLKLMIPDTSIYTRVSYSVILNFSGTSVSKLQIKLLNDQTKGKFFVDDVSLTVSSVVATETPTDQLNDTPVAVTSTPTTQPSSTEIPTQTPIEPSVTMPVTDVITLTSTATNTAFPSTLTETPTSTATNTFLSTPVRLLTSDGENGDELGSAIAIDGNTAVIGAPRKHNGQGSAYIFVWNGSAWIEQQKLTPDDPVEFDLFGDSVSISEDTVVIGAWSKDNYRGAVYIFTRSGTVWTQQQKLMSDNTEDILFGMTLAVQGNTVLVYELSQPETRGVVRVFTRAGNIWSEQQKLTPVVNNPNGNLEVALSGDTAIISASGDKNDAFVFIRNGSVWSEQQKMYGDEIPTVSQGLMSVALSGDTAIIGGADPIGQTVSIFTHQNGIWSEQQRLEASDFNPDQISEFGFSVALLNNIVVIGAPWKYEYGAVYVFKYNGDSWNEQQILINEIDNCFCAQFRFGYAVAVHTSTIIVGEPSGSTIGSVWVFPLP